MGPRRVNERGGRCAAGLSRLAATKDRREILRKVDGEFESEAWDYGPSGEGEGGGFKRAVQTRGRIEIVGPDGARTVGSSVTPQDGSWKKWVKRIEEMETADLANETGDWCKSNGPISLEVKVQEYSVPAFLMRLELSYPCSSAGTPTPLCVSCNGNLSVTSSSCSAVDRQSTWVRVPLLKGGAEGEDCTDSWSTYWTIRNALWFGDSITAFSQPSINNATTINYQGQWCPCNRAQLTLP